MRGSLIRAKNAPWPTNMTVLQKLVVMLAITMIIKYSDWVDALGLRG
jgi:hypothetical protein